MKKNALLLISLMLSCVPTNAQNHQVTQEEAYQAAKAWMEQNHPTHRTQGELRSLSNVRTNVLLYEVCFDSISLLLSGHKSCLPILGIYKNSGSIVEKFDSLPCNFKSFLEDYMNQVNQCFTEGIRNVDNEQKWNNLLDVIPHRSPARYYVVSPLITTKWGQSMSNIGGDPYAYNYYITPGDDCPHCLVGCGAVAMAQVMNYWQYPLLLISNKQLDWCNMTDILDRYSNNYESNRNAIAYLMDTCAKSIDSKFYCDRTSSNLPNTRKALVTKYGYSSNAVHIERGSSSFHSWIGRIKEDLNRKRPVLYKGSGTRGHAFVCDGYTNDDYFHFNWGWNGSWDGDFSVQQLTPAGSNFTNEQAAIFNVYPSTLHDICDANLNLDDFYSIGSMLMMGYNLYEITPQTMTTLTSASISSPAAWRTIPAGASAEYVAHEEVILEDGFEAEWGSEFEAWIEPCAKCGESRGDGSATRTLTQREDSLASDSTEATYMAPGHSEFTIHDSEFKIGLFPNPTDGPLTMETDGEVEAVVVYDAKGLPVGGWRLVGRSGRSLQLDVAALRPGAYILAVRTAAGTSTARFVRR